MADPVTWAFLLTAASAGAQAGGKYAEGKSKEQAALYQAAVAKNNQTLANQYAQMELDKGARLEEEKRRQTAGQLGRVRAAEGASGVEVNSGSALRLQEDTAAVGELDALTIRNASQRAAYGYRVKGMDYMAQATIDEMTARDASRAGALGAFSSLIGGASSVSDKWLTFQRAGLIGGGG